MPTYPWRFQADLSVDQPDPYVTVFVGDVHTNDSTGEKKIYPDTSDPMTVRLSELPAFLTSAAANGVSRVTTPPPGVATAKQAASP